MSQAPYPSQGGNESPAQHGYGQQSSQSGPSQPGVPPQGGQQAGYQQGYPQPADTRRYVVCGGRIVSPMLEGAQPSTAGKQVLSWLIDWLIFGIGWAVLTFLALIPMIIGLGSIRESRDAYGPVQDPDPGIFYGGLMVSITLTIVVAVGVFLLWWWLIATKGKTPGMHFMNQRLVSLETGKAVGWGPAFLRGLVIVFGGSLTGGVLTLLFWLSPLFDSTSGWFQGWHDKLIKAVYIDTRTGRDTAVS